MTIKYRYGPALTELTDTVVRIKGPINSAGTNADGSFDTAEIEVLDTNGSLTFQQLQPFVIEETDDTFDPQSFRGMIFNIKVNRGPFVTGPKRKWTLSVADINHLLKMRILKGAAAKRPKETGSARIAWLLTSIALSGLVYDNGEIASNLWEFEAADYRGKYAQDVLAEIVGAAAEDDRWVFFVYWDPVAGQPSLFFGGTSRTTFDSTIGLSNVPGDADGVTVFEAQSTPEPELDQAGEDVYDGVLVKYQGDAYRYVTLPATFATFGVHRDGFYENDRITSAAQADAQGLLWLKRHNGDKGQTDTVTVTARLPSTMVNHIQAGMRVQVRLQQIPGWSSWMWVRVQKRSFSMPVESSRKKWYDLHLTLSVRGWLSNAGNSGGGFPHQPADNSGSLVQHATGPASVNLPGPPTDGNLLLCWMTERGYGTYPPVPTGWTSIATAKKQTSPGINVYHGRLVYKIASGDSSTVVVFGTGQIMGTVTEWAGVTLGANVAQSDIASVNFTAGGAITPAAANAIVVGHGVIGAFFGVAVTPSAGVTELADDMFLGGNVPDNWVGYKKVATPASTIVGGTLTGNPQDYEYGGVTVVLLPAAAPEPPGPGTWVYGELVTLTAGAGTTAWPFADGSLHVKYDIVDQTPAIVSYDGATGAFQMPSQPPLGTQVFVDYQGR